MKKKAFTLIELIAVLVILAILSLIVTPLVMNIIRKAKTAADKRSIDAYGRSIEIAIAGYLLDTGTFPTSMDQLTVEYSGDRVVCSTTQIKSDSSVYLAGCTVAGRSVDYTYGENKTPTYEAYSVGDEVTYNNVDYYVIKDSSESDDTVTLLKAEPLTVEEVNLYGGVGTENNHVNKYTYDSRGTASSQQGYGGVQYYSSETCTEYGDTSGCNSDYYQSEVKYVVDAWANVEVPKGLVEARLIDYDELINGLGCSYNSCGNSNYNWLYISTGAYWTMTPYNESMTNVWTVGSNGDLKANYGPYNDTVRYTSIVRPVITISKSVLE